MAVNTTVTPVTFEAAKAAVLDGQRVYVGVSFDMPWCGAKAGQKLFIHEPTADGKLSVLIGEKLVTVGYGDISDQRIEAPRMDAQAWAALTHPIREALVHGYPQRGAA